MRRLRNLFGLFLLLWSFGWVVVSTAHAATSADAIPKSASVVARWKSPAKSLEKVADFVDAVQPGIGDVIRDSLPGMGEAVGNPDLKGVDTDQDLWAIVFAEPHGIPTVVYVVTAKDVDDVKDGLASNYQVHVEGNVVAYSEHEDALGEVRDRLSGKGESLWKIVDAAQKKLIDASDFSVLVNVKQLAEDFSDELQQAEPQLDAFLDQVTAAMPEAQRPQMEVAFGMYRDLGKSVLHSVKDTNSYALGATISATSIRIESRVQVTAGTDTAKFFASQPGTDLPLLNKLPLNKPVYVGMKFDMGRMIDWSLKVTKDMMTDASDEKKAELDAVSKEMKKLKFDEMAVYFELAGKAPALRAGSVTTVTPANRVREITLRMLKSMGDIEMFGMTQKTTLEENAAKIGNATADRVTIKQEYDESADPLGIQQKMQDVLFGDDGMQYLYLYQPKYVLQTFGGGAAEMQNLVTASDATKKDPAVGAARKLLGEKANLVVLVDIARLMVNGFKLAGAEEALTVDVEALDGLNQEPSFIGYSVVCEPTSLNSQLEIPLVQVQNIAKLIPLVGPAQ